MTADEGFKDDFTKVSSNGTKGGANDRKLKLYEITLIEVRCL